ncbi:MAG: phospho-sugar mutase, partial [Bacteroidales bacterium]|nr:phospho-sugar mutase [Bacteroidales bacterium]
LEFGLFRESLISVTKKGKSGSEEIRKMMDDFRNTPPRIINGSKVIMIKDYKSCEAHDLLTGEKSKINLPASNVLQFFMEDGSKISVRPSGTEPKIKFYFGVMNELNSRSDFEKINDILDQRIRNIINDMKLV